MHRCAVIFHRQNVICERLVAAVLCICNPNPNGQLAHVSSIHAATRTVSMSVHIDYAAELNEQQLAAVSAPPGPILVIAGAGSGKTRTLTYRVAFLLEQGIPADRILLLTFTNKAAGEMMHRVSDLLGHELRSLWGG